MTTASRDAISWPQCSLQAINLTPFTNPVDVTLVINGQWLNISQGNSDLFLNWTVLPSIPADTYLQIYVWKAGTVDKLYEGVEYQVVSNGKDYGNATDCGTDIVASDATPIWEDNGAVGVSWPQCSQQLVSAGQNHPANISVYSSNSGNAARIATNVLSEVYPVNVAYAAGDQLTYFLDQPFGYGTLAFSGIRVGDSGDSSCIQTNPGQPSSQSSSLVSSSMETQRSSTAVSLTSSSTSTSPTVFSALSHSTPSIAAVAGGSAGGGIAIAMVLGALLFCWWRRRQHRRRAHALDIDGAEDGGEGLPAYEDTIAPAPTPLTRAVSSIDRSQTPMTGRDLANPGSPRFSREKSPLGAVTSYPHHSRADSNTILLSESRPSSGGALRAHNPEITGFDTAVP